MGTLIFVFCVYWLVFFVACFTIVEVAQDQLYDEVTPHAGLKITGGTFLLALVATYYRPAFDTMFTNDLKWTVLQAIIWVAVFILVFQFHPTHGLGLALGALLIIPGLATLGVDNLTKPTPVTAPVQSRGAPPVRKSLTPPAEPPKTAAPAK